MKLNSIKNLLPVIILLFTVMGFESCLKDNDFEDGDTQSFVGDPNQKVVQIPITANSSSNHVQFAFDNVDKDTTFNAVPVALAGKPASEDIQVTLIVNPALLGSYNADNGTAHEEMPTSLYTVSNPGDSATGYVVTIPKGSSVGYLEVKVNPSKIIGSDYALGLQIAQISPSGYRISSNYNWGIAAIGTKNDLDGIYSFKGYILREGDPVLTGNFTGLETPLITTGAYSNTFSQVWSDGSGVGGIDGLTVVVNPATNKVTMLSTSNLALTNMPGYDNRYDPATRTFYLSFYWGTGPTNRMATDTLTYLRPR